MGDRAGGGGEAGEGMVLGRTFTLSFYLHCLNCFTKMY